MRKNIFGLGTAQFGLDYGINNKRGKIPKPEVFKILLESWRRGIDTLDTAKAYGESERIIGSFIKKYKKDFKIISKLPKENTENIREVIDSSLRTIGISKFYGYLIHNFQDYKNHPELWDNLQVIKKEGKIEKIGFSLYFPEDLEYLFKHKITIDIIQIPYGVFDRRFEEYFGFMKKSDIEIHVRSVFLQGLVFKKANEMEGAFVKIKDKIEALNELAERTKTTIHSICLNFAAVNKYIDKIVIGIDSLKDLREILESTKDFKKIKGIYEELSVLRESDEKIILPIYWN